MKTQSERLKWFLDKLEMTFPDLAKTLGYTSPDTIFQILSNKTEIRKSFVEKLKKIEPAINPEWLISGQGEPFNYKIEKGKYGNEYRYKGKFIYPARLDFYYLRKIAIAIASVIMGKDPINKNHEVEARTVAIDGVEFIYKQFTVEKGERHDDRYYSIILLPDWTFTGFFDFWKHFNFRSLQSQDMRCENLFDIEYVISYQKLVNVVYPILKEIETTNALAEEDCFLFNQNAIVKIYNTNMSASYSDGEL